MNLPKQHFDKSRELLKAIDKQKIAEWLLMEGYFPEQYVLPPSFRVAGWHLRSEEFLKDLTNLPRRQLANISYPKSKLTSRVFSIQHPHNYHDIVYWLIKEWSLVLDLLFNKNIRVYSYSFPIPISTSKKGELGPLRSGRMIYEWIGMAEKDMVAEADKFQFIVRTDITNYYNSIYTHSISWALHGREEALSDKENKLLGNKIDRLVQYANDGRTNGIPVGSALTDLIAEIILSKIDLNISNKLNNIDFIATRFKDDYRFLCNTKEDANTILRVITRELSKFNLLINESKTHILTLPHGLYRQHDREYHPYSLRKKDKILFREFEITLLKAIDIHRQFPGTSLLETFFSELFDQNYKLKVTFSGKEYLRKIEILKACSLIILAKRESEKVLCWSLAVIEDIYVQFYKDENLKAYLKKIISAEMQKASFKQSAFELNWLIFFSRYIGLGITNLTDELDKSEKSNPFIKSIIASQQKLFNDTHVDLFRKPKDCKDVKLAERLDIFNKNRDDKN